MDSITKQYDESVERIARASAFILDWRQKAAGLIADVVHKEYDEVAVPGIKAVADDKLEAIIADMRAGTCPLIRRKKITEPALAELLGSPFGIQLATSVMKTIDRGVMPIVMKARRTRDSKVQELMVLHGNENRSTSIYEAQERTKTAEEAMIEIERRSEGKYPAKPGKKK